MSDPTQEPPISAPPIHLVVAPIETPDAQPPEKPPVLQKLPIPKYVLVLAVVTVVAFGLGLMRTPRVISMGVKAEEGSRALQAGNYIKAIPLLKAVHDSYPSADDVTIDLADAYIKGDDPQEALPLLQSFDGKKVSKEQSERLNGLESQIDAIAQAIMAQDQEDAKKAKGGKK